MRGLRVVAMLECLTAIVASPRAASAWIFPEHTRITQRAVAGLERASTDPEIRAALAQVEAALGLCRSTSDAPTGCVSLAALPSLAGDHSCTPLQLRGYVERARSSEPWVLGVLAVAATTDAKLRAAGGDAHAREDARRQMHVSLQAEDERYVARALVDYSHFQLPRQYGDGGDLAAYLDYALASARQANATAAYVNYHVVAVRLADAARTAATPGSRTEYLVRAVLAESFALHFLEDTFSSGHFVGHWGDEATRLGTHDFYSHRGVEAARWASPAAAFVAHGDAFLTDDEEAAAATAVFLSLSQVVRAATDAAVAAEILAQFQGVLGVEQYDSCGEETAAPTLGVAARSDALREVLSFQPIPAAEYPPLLRVRAEEGFFFGAAAAVEGGFMAVEKLVDARMRASIRAGFGAAGIVSDPMNAQAFLDGGVFGEYLASSPSVDVIGVTVRVRAPGYLVFVDGAIAILLAQATKSDARCPFCLNWAAAAAAGGAGRLWKSRHLSDSTTWQLSLLRDGTLNVFRRDAQYRTELFAPLVSLRSALPIAGDAWSQSSEIYVDVGPSAAWSSEHPTVFPGAYLSLSTTTRVFP